MTRAGDDAVGVPPAGGARSDDEERRKMTEMSTEMSSV
jgi:hypothetical protein